MEGTTNTPKFLYYVYLRGSDMVLEFFTIDYSKSNNLRWERVPFPTLGV